MRQIIFLMLALFIFCSCNLVTKKYTVTQGFDGEYVSPSCASFQTDVWYGNEIVRAWFDNGCLLTDSLIQKRLDDANAMASMLNKKLK